MCTKFVPCICISLTIHCAMHNMHVYQVFYAELCIIYNVYCFKVQWSLYASDTYQWKIENTQTKPEVVGLF